eukprot:Protomagalhaensia_wolfi_Nauph_80__5918@NODE_777_length_2011_cov_10_741379_g585_i0_p2_GENE_NODE_777_length_2011_cov_10_741379_g585_i0NODE_777_length_2011_cov_10_741379_g585_i0_p2_ORF_typecomplete_len110_score21_76XRN1_DBM/PF18245_1/0_14_NODE_777_length_2011_cov_10_741379_g585_i0441770
MRSSTSIYEGPGQDLHLALSLFQALVAGIPSYQLTESANEFLKGENNIKDFLGLDKPSTNHNRSHNPQQVPALPLPPLHTVFGQLVALTIQLYHEEADKWRTQHTEPTT